ncbi:hypothetical protein MO973_20550 [Paenibacillus sp. TRM 82003]|nr:hypothetical protein [Paenibacillus sp. TRM 82003]
MTHRLIADTIRLLQRGIPAEAGVTLEWTEAPLDEMAALLQRFELGRTRKTAILGGFFLLCLSLQCHREVAGIDNRTMTKRILDGDFLQGYYFSFAARAGEHALLAYLTPALKSIQLRLAQGDSVDTAIRTLFDRVAAFLRTECQPIDGGLRGGGGSDEAA